MSQVVNTKSRTGDKTVGVMAQQYVVLVEGVPHPLTRDRRVSDAHDHMLARQTGTCKGSELHTLALFSLCSSLSPRK